MDQRPIGLFDSGVGGLTVVREFQRLMPHEDIVYLGDTGRVPYGTRSRETIQKYAAQDIAFLLSHNVKMVVAACGTASSALSPAVTDALPVPYTGVVIPSAQAAAVATSSGNVGVIGTAATVHSGAFGKAIRNIRTDVKVTGLACPLFVPLVENGFFGPEDPIARPAAEHYLAGLRGSTVDTLILGCTHYPMLTQLIADILGPDIQLVNPGVETASFCLNYLMTNGLMNSPAHTGVSQYFCTDSVDGFCAVAQKFFGEFSAEDVKKVEADDLPTL